MNNDTLWTMAQKCGGSVFTLDLSANDLSNLEQETFILFLTFWEIQIPGTSNQRLLYNFCTYNAPQNEVWSDMNDLKYLVILLLSQFYCVLCSMNRSLYYPNYMLVSHVSIFSLLLYKINLRCDMNLKSLAGAVVSLSHFDQTREQTPANLHQRCHCLGFKFQK